MLRDEKLSVTIGDRILELDPFILLIKNKDKTITAEQIENVRKDLLERRKHCEVFQKQKMDNALWELAFLAPINEEEPFSRDKSVALDASKKLISTIDGWVFYLEDLAKWIEIRGEWRHPTNPEYVFDLEDKERIRQLAKTHFEIDLSDKKLNPREFTKELEEESDEIMNEPVISQLISEDSEMKSSPMPHPALVSRYTVDSPLILHLATLMKREPQYLVEFEAKNPERFDAIIQLQDYVKINRLSWDALEKIPLDCIPSLICAFPYVKEKVISLDEAKQFNKDEIEILRQTDSNPDKKSLIARLNIIRPQKFQGGFLTQEKDLKFIADETGIAQIDLAIYCRQNPHGLKTLQDNVEKLIDYMPEIKAEKLTIEKALTKPKKSTGFFARTSPTEFKEANQIAEITTIPVETLNAFCIGHPKEVSRLIPNTEKLLAAATCINSGDMSVGYALNLSRMQVDFLQTVDYAEISPEDVVATCEAMKDSFTQRFSS